MDKTQSFHALIKREWMNQFRIANLDAAKTLVWEYIETFYNTVRIHSHCNYMSPDQCEHMYEKAIVKNLKLVS
ncbi:MAG: IS3 family transposase [Firmicutes bacterium]|nr:IS3 family transposase [Bacillota bacterium]